MINFYPAIDLKDGQCVRLLRGDMDKATVFNASSGDQAKQFVDAGSEWIHVVDLNGAFAGAPVNSAAVQDILHIAKGRASVQLGGGIRSLEQMEFWLKQGVTRLILGTIAVKNPTLVKQACKEFPGHIAVGIDANNGFVATEGWADVSTLQTVELAKQFMDAGVSAIIHTDIGRDGAMQGANIQASVALAEAVSIPVIVSGGISSMEELLVLKELGHHSIDGVISGRAIYDGVIDVAKAIALLNS